MGASKEEPEEKNTTSSNRRRSSKMAPKLDKIGTILLLVVAIVIIGLCIGGIANAQLMFSVHVLIVILVLTLFSLVIVALIRCGRGGSSSGYDVEKEGSRAGASASASSANGARHHAARDNAGFVSDGGKSDDKWVSNYVPYGDFPAGSNANANTNASKDESAAPSWKKNYVPYEEGETGRDEVDSNKKG